jgi:hypothetical protein
MKSIGLRIGKAVRGMTQQKKIDLDKGREALTHLDEVPNPIVSTRQFVIQNFDTLRQSGKTLKALYDFLTSRGFDLGTFESFRADYNSERRARKLNSSEPKKGKPATAAPTEAEKAKNGEDIKNRPRGLGLRPIYLADGTEVEIDPETGAKRFKIKSNRRPQE